MIGPKDYTGLDGENQDQNCPELNIKYQRRSLNILSAFA